MLYCPYLEKTVLISNHVNVIHYFPGAYVPLTVEGKIIVDGVLASCYADFHQDLAYVAMIPMQQFSKVMEWTLGNDTGFPVYVSIARKIGMLMLPDGLFWG